MVFTDCKEKKDRPFIVALKNAGKGTVGGKVITCNVVTSAYGRNGFTEFLNNSLRSNCLLFYDIKKSRDLVVSAGLQLPGLLAKYDSNSIIRRYDENVNTFKQKFLTNPKNYLPEQYGQTLCRSDGLPIAYVDSDGRQRQYEYGKRANGSSYISKTTVIFSDGRSEITEYNEGGNITLLERVNADGRDSYSFSSDGIGFYANERSIEYRNDNEYLARKSIHEKTREKKEERGRHYDSTKETWKEYDERDNNTLNKYNLYGDNDKLQHASEIKYSYDNYGNVVSSINKDGCVNIIEYYPPSKVRDYFGYTLDDYNAGAIDHNKIKSATSKYPDGSIRIIEYTIEGKSTQVDYSADGKLTAFRSDSGDTFHGQAAELAYLKSRGQAPNKAQKPVAATRQTAPKSGKNVKADKGKTDGRRGSSGR